MPTFDLSLEPALRYAVTNRTESIAYIAKKFRVETDELVAWFCEFNKGGRLLSGVTIDQAKELAGHATSTKLTPAPRPIIVPPPIPAPVKLTPTADLKAWLAAQKINTLVSVVTYQVKVTPEIAASWLKLNSGNRNPSKSKIRRFADSIRAGRWTLTGETIKFGASGRLLDGQSRLMAIQLAQVPAVLEIRAGLPDEAQKSMDIGEIRKGTHTLEMMGEKYPAVLAPALKMVFAWGNNALSECKSGSKTKTVMENFHITPLLEKHKGLKSSVGWVMTEGEKISSLLQPSTAAFFHYILGLADTDLRDKFFEALAQGEGLTKASPIYHLRERLMSDRMNKVQSARKREHRALVILAWNHVRRGDRVTGLRFTLGDDFPDIEGLKKAE